MHRFNKSKKGFTLLEMILVVCIILILASVVIAGVRGYIKKSNDVSNNLSSVGTSVHNANASYESKFVNYGF
ncbi:MAG: putative major pilin subunit [Firmicutes bacterium ADurb.Bin419]|nr:MAG: putative major pilin subunit [Firmicutes bacterium ADurb.Bin419]